MRSACASAIVVGLLGCAPKGSSQPPEPGPPVADVADDAAGGAGDASESAETPGPEEETSPEPEAGGDDPSGSTDPSAEAGTEADAGSETDGADAGSETASATPEPKNDPEPVVAKLDLPKPVHGKVDGKCGRDAGVGSQLKSFSLPGLEEGKTITNGSFRGRVQVVNFWGTWCKPCLKELPEFDQLYRRYRKYGMTLLAIATDEDAETVKDTVTKKKLGAKIAIAGEAYAGQYGSPKFPFTFVVDYKGVIRGSYRGYKPECMGKLEADIREQLQVRAEAKARRKKKKSS